MKKHSLEDFKKKYGVSLLIIQCKGSISHVFVTSKSSNTIQHLVSILLIEEKEKLIDSS